MNGNNCKLCGFCLDGTLHLTGCPPASNLEGLASREPMVFPLPPHASVHPGEFACTECGCWIPVNRGGVCDACTPAYLAKASPTAPPRPTWGQTFMDVADVFSRRATCPRLSVGALLVQEGGIPGPGGYNGSRRGAPHCNDVGCDLQTLNGRESCQRAVHAEANAIFNAGRVGFKTGGSTLYVTAAPCLRCVDAIIQAGIIRVVYRDAYGLDGVGLLKAAGVQVEQLSK